MLNLKRLLRLHSYREERMTWNSIPLRRALLCGDCEFISVGVNDCPMCGSRAILTLSAILQREARVEPRGALA